MLLIVLSSMKFSAESDLSCQIFLFMWFNMWSLFLISFFQFTAAWWHMVSSFRTSIIRSLLRSLMNSYSLISIFPFFFFFFLFSFSYFPFLFIYSFLSFPLPPIFLLLHSLRHYFFLLIFCPTSIRASKLFSYLTDSYYVCCTYVLLRHGMGFTDRCRAHRGSSHPIQWLSSWCL